MYDAEYVFKTIEECDLNNRPMYKELMKHLRENEHLLQNQPDKDDKNYEKELLIKNEELINLRRKNDDKRTSLINKNDIYDEFINQVKEQQENRLDESWNKISKDMEEGLKSLEMIISLTENKSDQLKEIKINESSLKEANDILRHFCEKK